MCKPIIILNAPPQTGKDTLGRILTSKCNMVSAAFKDPMFLIAATTLGLSVEKFMSKYEVEGWKDSFYVSEGRTVRDLMIHLSENYVKPFFGSSYFGDYLTKSIIDFEELEGEESWVITDGGFTEEIEPLVKAFGKRVVIIQLERDGHRDFGTDSRNWLNIEGVETFRFDTTRGNEHVVDMVFDLIIANSV